MPALDQVVTFIPSDPPRTSWFALWRPEAPGGLFGQSSGGADLEQVELAVPAGSSIVRELVAVERLEMADAIRLLAVEDPTEERPRSETAHAWGVAIVSALSLVARGRMLPTVSPDGFDAWRLDPLDPADRAHLTVLGDAMPYLGLCQPLPRCSRIRLEEPVELVTKLYNAVADTFVRTAAAPAVTGSAPFADRESMRVPHLKAWAGDVAAVHCAGTGLVLRVLPPGTFEPSNVENSGPSWLVVLQLRSQQDPSLIIKARDLWMTPREVLRRFGPDAETELLAGLRRAVDICPALAPALDDSAPSEIELTDEGLDELLERLDALADSSIEVRWPSEIVAPNLQRRLVVSTSAPGGSLPSVNDLDSLLTVDWEFLLEGLPLTADELDSLSEAKRGIVPIRGRWIRLDRRARAKLKARTPDLRAADALAAALGTGLDVLAPASGELALDLDLDLDEEPIEVDVRGAVKQIAERILALDGEREEPEPMSLKATLRPYQRRGLAWMADLCDIGFGGCLADDMGLGKTIQVLALHAHRNANGHPGATLVICPTSLMANWERETHRFLPGTIVHRFHGPNRSLASVEAGDIVITTYGVVRSDLAALADPDLDITPWGLVVADEAQHAKNPRSRTAKALRLIPSASRIALTGTPVENRLTELWSIMDWATPGLLGPLATFKRMYAKPIEKDGDMRLAAALTTTVRPFLLRRKKTDPGIAPELPPKTERDVIVPLTAEQISLYKATTTEALEDLKDNDGLARHGLVLKMLTALKQITNHPAQFLAEDGPIPGRSGKIDALDGLVDIALDNEEQILIFSQFVSMGKLLLEHLASQGISADLLHGGLPVSRRQQLVDRFQQGELKVLVLSLKAGGTGLNLTAATQVIHYDRWWNPAVEDQATDRAYRIGQDRPVTVHRIITEGTVEDRVAQLLAEKRRLADQVIRSDVGEDWIGNMNDEELTDMVLLEWDKMHGGPPSDQQDSLPSGADGELR